MDIYSAHISKHLKVVNWQACAERSCLYCMLYRMRVYLVFRKILPRRRWEDNIKMNLQVVEWGIHWIDVAQKGDKRRALVNAVISLWFNTVQGVMDWLWIF
jgi:hypothetical protein